MTLFGYGQEVATSDDYYTPAWLFEDMAVEFDLDVAAPPGGVPWIPCKRFLTMADDGLATPWEGRVWMNPPYSKPKPWVARFIEHGNGIALLPVSKGRWYVDLWESGASVIKSGEPFIFNGAASDMPIPLFLWAFGDWAVEAIGRIGHVR
jgi:hypothetical protein